jgi:hypothetical protein
VDTSNPTVGCYDEDNDTYYLQLLPENDPLYFRVNDTNEDGVWTSNTGELKLAIYSVVGFNAWPSGCALQYKIGDLIEQKTVDASWSNGWPLDSDRIQAAWPTGGENKPGRNVRYYMLETLGGPAVLGASGGYSWASDMAERATVKDLHPSTWYPTEEAPFVECVQVLDTVGHVRVFFRMDTEEDVEECKEGTCHTTPIWTSYYYAFRVHDDIGAEDCSHGDCRNPSFDDNTGSLTYKLYQATFIQLTQPGEPPGPTGCQSFSHDATALSTITINAQASMGAVMPTLLSGSM